MFGAFKEMITRYAIYPAVDFLTPPKLPPNPDEGARVFTLEGMGTLIHKRDDGALLVQMDDRPITMWWGKNEATILHAARER